MMNEFTAIDAERRRNEEANVKIDFKASFMKYHELVDIYIDRYQDIKGIDFKELRAIAFAGFADGVQRYEEEEYDFDYATFLSLYVFENIFADKFEKMIPDSEIKAILMEFEMVHGSKPVLEELPELLEHVYGVNPEVLGTKGFEKKLK